MARGVATAAGRLFPFCLSSFTVFAKWLFLPVAGRRLGVCLAQPPVEPGDGPDGEAGRGLKAGPIGKGVETS